VLGKLFGFLPPLSLESVPATLNSLVPLPFNRIIFKDQLEKWFIKFWLLIVFDKICNYIILFNKVYFFIIERNMFRWRLEVAVVPTKNPTWMRIQMGGRISKRHG
jgi:hypothetical protein